MRAVGAVLFVASISARAEPCLTYGKVTLQGRLSEEVFAHGEKIERLYFVSPDQPRCVRGSGSTTAVTDVAKVEIEINMKGGWPIMKELLGQPVSCYGELYHSQGPGQPSTRWHDHHHSAVVLRGMCHAVQPGAPAGIPRAPSSSGAAEH